MSPRGPGEPLPALRAALEAVPVEKDGRTMFVLRDLEDLTDEGIALSAGGMLVASLLDGKRGAAEVAALFAKSAGGPVKPEEVSGLAEQLEAAGLLETPEVARLRERILRDFRESRARKAAFAGRSYPKEPAKLGASLVRFFKDAKGPGKEAAPEGFAAPPRGLVAPHIDFSRGGPAYAWAYETLSRSRPPDLVVALGVAHMSPNSPWAMTRKAYETPYGAVALDEGLYADLASCLWYDPLDDELVHRGEHSLEFQAVWLKWLWRDKTPPWVPVLCSSFERFCPDKPPSTVPTVDGAIEKLCAALRARAAKGQRVLVLAGVDLAHVGPRFGDDLEPTPELAAKIEAEDRASLEKALALSADEFYLSVVKGGHWRKVCGLSALYTSLRLIKAVSDAGAPEGRLLTYGQAPDPSGGLVSFASAVFPR